MSMERQFKSAKLQVTMVGDQHPKGVTHLFNNVSQQFENEQLTSLTEAVALLTSEECVGVNVITTDHIALA
ncbi:hypothetical protein [Limosilactobacillus sp.]|uniref:DUF1659 domain-containing protein n=1 Tax=Limosilactobacillus sp. TaxID=2773925 RepID=UPI003F0C5BF3